MILFSPRVRSKFYQILKSIKVLKVEVRIIEAWILGFEGFVFSFWFNFDRNLLLLFSFLSGFSVFYSLQRPLVSRKVFTYLCCAIHYIHQMVVSLVDDFERRFVAYVIFNPIGFRFLVTVGDIWSELAPVIGRFRNTFVASYCRHCLKKINKLVLTTMYWRIVSRVY